MTGRASGATLAGLLVLSLGIASAGQAQRRSRPVARGPSITIVEPKAGSLVRGSTVTVSVLVKRFKPTGRQFRPPVAGEGHVHFYLDAKRIPTTHVYPSPVHYHSISGTAYTWTGVSPGRHTFAVQLVGNDHVPLRPQVKDHVTVVVR